MKAKYWIEGEKVCGNCPICNTPTTFAEIVRMKKEDVGAYTATCRVSSRAWYILAGVLILYVLLILTAYIAKRASYEFDFYWFFATPTVLLAILPFYRLYGKKVIRRRCE